MIKQNTAFVVFLGFVLLLNSCKSNEKLSHITVVSYNVENLFDTEKDKLINDEEFLPGSEKQWTKERYKKKLDDIARVLTSIDDEDLPEIIGLAEVENRRVLEDLIKTKAMSRGHYAIVHQDSPDERGIDVALLYRPTEFKMLSFDVIPITGSRTRDILHVSGKFGNESFHFFVNHWPSRNAGLEKSEPARMKVAEALKKKVKQVLSQDPIASIVIMGDMNDTPENKSLKNILGAGMPGSKSDLVNLMMPLARDGKGTYCYRGRWDMLDNLVVSKSLLDAKGFRVNPVTGYIFSADWMNYTDNKGNVVPNRTYGGPNYYGGVSDHYPIYFELIK